MKERVTVYALTAIAVIFSLYGGGFLVSMVTVLSAFSLIERVKRSGYWKARELPVVATVGLFALVIAFVMQFLR